MYHHSESPKICFEILSAHHSIQPCHVVSRYSLRIDINIYQTFSVSSDTISYFESFGLHYGYELPRDNKILSHTGDLFKIKRIIGAFQLKVQSIRRYVTRLLSTSIFLIPISFSSITDVHDLLILQIEIFSLAYSIPNKYTRTMCTIMLSLSASLIPSKLKSILKTSTKLYRKTV